MSDKKIDFMKENLPNPSGQAGLHCITFRTTTLYDAEELERAFSGTAEFGENEKACKENRQAKSPPDFPNNCSRTYQQ